MKNDMKNDMTTPANARKIKQQEMLCLHGVKVPTRDYSRIERLASIVHGRFDIGVDEKYAWRESVRIAVLLDGMIDRFVKIASWRQAMMINSKHTQHTAHTPGPWRVDAVARVFAEDTRWANTQYIADINLGWDCDEGNANARLIAAAPDLLAALEWALERVDPIGAHAQMEQARAAIRKARSGVSEANGTAKGESA